MLKPQHHRTNSKVQEDNVPVVSDEQLKKAKEEAVNKKGMKPVFNWGKNKRIKRWKSKLNWQKQ